MPKGKTRKFIDQKNSVSFHLVHRSQRDPLTADETAPQRVLVPVCKADNVHHEKNKIHKTKEYKEKQHKYGIFFDDDYDYLQHLKDVNILSTEWERVENINKDKKHGSEEEKSKISLPSSVFESNVEEKVGLMNRTCLVSGLQLDLDPDVVAALDDDFDFENPDNQLEDNFIELADTTGLNEDEFDKNSLPSNETSDEICTDHDKYEDRYEEGSSIFPQYTFKDEETKSRFTQYSISSSVMKRSDHLALLDNKFEKMYTGYDDNEIGALDCDETEGYIDPNSNAVLQYATDHRMSQNQHTENLTKLLQDRMKIRDDCSSSEESEDNISLEKLIVQTHGKDKWDCESILSTYSNIYNHPKLISETKDLPRIKVNSKSGIPESALNRLNQNKLTAENLVQFSTEYTTPRATTVASTMKSIASAFCSRSKNETQQEKRERKQVIKQYRKERRKERKVNIVRFKEEKMRQEKMFINEKNNIQGNRIL